MDIQRLTVAVGPRHQNLIVNDVSLSVAGAEIVGLIGESGAGKSTTARTLLGLRPHGARITGHVLWQGQDILTLRQADLRRYRSRTVGAVFQDPRASVNPMHRISHFVLEGMRTNLKMNSAAAHARAVELLGSVGMDGERVLRRFPHELSGGMLQRVVIATALAGQPELLVADEPTTALDVTTQAEVMAILRRLRRERQLAIVLVTHNLELAAAMCDRIYVMHRGSVVESGSADDVIRAPKHEYTRSLLRATLGVSGKLAS